MVEECRESKIFESTEIFGLLDEGRFFFQAAGFASFVYHACDDSFLQLRFLLDLRMMGNVNFPTTASGKHVLWAIHPATGQ